jgi:hypothetical protein
MKEYKGILFPEVFVEDSFSYSDDDKLLVVIDAIAGLALSNFIKPLYYETALSKIKEFLKCDLNGEITVETLKDLRTKYHEHKKERL